MKKLALLIGVSEYQPGLSSLPGALKDVQALQRVLEDPEVGKFDGVKALVNPDPLKMQEEIETLFAERDRDDLVLLFFSGHGIKDDTGKLYFATCSTRKTARGELVRSTAVPAGFIHEVMGKSRSKRQVVLLDCCFSGAFAEGMTAKDDGVVDVQKQLGGEGRAVLTSSTSTQYSFETQGTELSIYTRYIVEGIETGAADQDNDGSISVEDLHEYAKRKVQENAPAMKPEIYAIKEGFKILLARARVGDPKLRYRREVERFADRGEIPNIVRAALDMRWHTLGLLSEEASAIESEVLQPSRSYKESLRQYEQKLLEAMLREFPLSAETRGDLKYLQQALGLRDEDVQPIEEHLSARRTGIAAAIASVAPGVAAHAAGNAAPVDPFSALQPLASTSPFGTPPPVPASGFSPNRPTPARGGQPVKLLLAGLVLVALVAGGSYAYYAWQVEQAGQSVLHQGTELANQGRLQEAIATLAAIPPSSAVYDQAQVLLANCSDQIVQQAVMQFNSGQMESAIALLQTIPQHNPLYTQAQERLGRWQQDFAEDQSRLAEIRRVLEVDDLQTAQALVQSMATPELKRQAEAILDQETQVVSANQRQQIQEQLEAAARRNRDLQRRVRDLQNQVQEHTWETRLPSPTPLPPTSPVPGPDSPGTSPASANCFRVTGPDTLNVRFDDNPDDGVIGNPFTKLSPGSVGRTTGRTQMATLPNQTESILWLEISAPVNGWVSSRLVTPVPCL